MWIDDLKFAIATRDSEMLASLIEDLPEFEHQEELKSALYLVNEALDLIKSLKDETALSMSQIRKNKEFLNSTHFDARSNLDIKL